MDQLSVRSLMKPFWVCAVALLLVASTLAPRSFAQGNGAISGRVVNGTPDGPTPKDLEVVLHRVRGETYEGDQRTRADADGNFSFTGLDTSTDYAYYVVVTYLGVPYSSDGLHFEPGKSAKEVEIKVYETTEADPGLRVSLSAVVVGAAEPSSRMLEMFEVVTLVNPGDRTYVPNSSGPAGPTALVRFYLPPGATDLQFGANINPEDVIQVNLGFAMTSPFAPGPNELHFSYRVPYEGGQYRFERTFPYPVETLRILVPQNITLADVGGLAPGEGVSMGSEQYLLWERRGLKAREQLAFRMEGLRQGSLLESSPISRIPREALGGLGVVLALVAVGGYALRRRSTSQPVEGDDAAFDEDITEELDRLAELDELFAAGNIPQQEYEEERARAKAVLMAQWRNAPWKFAGLEQEEVSGSQVRKD